MKVAAGFESGPGMIEQLRELAEAEPFRPFTVRLTDGTKLHVATPHDVQFTHFGSPKVRSTDKHSSLKDLGRRGSWHILNVDAIVEIILC